MITKILKFGVFAFIFGFGFAGVADDSAAAGLNLESLKTKSGRVFMKVELITADAHGLLFRHAKGTAKVDFAELSDNLREMFEPEPVAEKKPQPVAEENGKGDEPGDVVSKTTDRVTIYTRTRVVVNPPTRMNPCCPSQIAWLPHWSRYHGAHTLAYFRCRQLVEADFLISSGLIPAPRGVVTRVLPRRGY